jgi:hypothetical protein
MDEPARARAPRSFYNVLCTDVMHSLECVRAFLRDDSHQMNHRIAALQALIESNTAYNVTCNEFYAVVILVACFLEIADQPAHGVAFIQQSPEQVPPHEACDAGEKDLHSLILIK